MKKSLVLAMAMALGVTASAYAANPFSDVPAGHWAYDAVNKLAAAGVVDGYPDGTYGGDKLMTRYEMAQIVAKAMAKGANVDKLAAEFADELDSLGVRVANLEKKADNVKITGQIRASYKDVDGDANSHKLALRSRLWVEGQVNEDWTYTAMLQNDRDMSDSDSSEDDKLDLNRAYVNGRVGGLDLQAGRWDEVTFTGNVLDSYIDGVKVSYGDKVKVFGLAAKGAGDGHDAMEYMFDSEDRLYVAGVTADMGAVDAYAAYFKTDVSKAAGETVAENKEIWNVGVNYNFAPDFVLSGEYMRGDEEYVEGAGKDGWAVDLAWKGASADEPGSYGLHVGYMDQSDSAYITPTSDGFDSSVFDAGYKGMVYGASYAFAKNIVGVFNYYDFEDKESGADADTMFTELYFTF